MEAPSGSIGDGDLRRAPLVDASRIPLHELMNSDDPVLTRSLQRVLLSLDDPDGVISAFQSYAS